MTKLVLARNDPLTSFDLRAQIFRVNVEFSTSWTNIFFEKMSESDLSARKIFFGSFVETMPFEVQSLNNWWPTKYKKDFFRAVGVLSDILSNYDFILWPDLTLLLKFMLENCFFFWIDQNSIWNSKSAFIQSKAFVKIKVWVDLEGSIISKLLTRKRYTQSNYCILLFIRVNTVQTQTQST